MLITIQSWGGSQSQVKIRIYWILEKVAAAALQFHIHEDKEYNVCEQHSEFSFRLRHQENWTQAEWKWAAS